MCEWISNKQISRPSKKLEENKVLENNETGKLYQVFQMKNMSLRVFSCSFPWVTGLLILFYFLMMRGLKNYEKEEENKTTHNNTLPSIP